MPDTVTKGMLAESAGVPFHTVVYVCNKLRLVPIGRVANICLYSKADAARAMDVLLDIAAKRRERASLQGAAQ